MAAVAFGSGVQSFIATAIAVVVTMAVASPAWAATFTATAAVGSAVTMDDPTGSVTYTITNTTAGPARFIDRVRFYFTRTQYFIARGTTAPTNWRVAAISNPPAGAESYVEFQASNAAARIAPGASLAFTVMLQGTSYANLPRSAADATDLNTRVRSRDNTGLWTNQTGVAPSWARKALALTFQPSPLGLGPGQTLGLTAQIENRSTAAQAASVVANPTGGCGSSPNPPCPTYTGSASILSLTGPTPASLNLAAGRQGAIDWTYTAGSGTGTVYFRGRAQSGATATSIDVSSPTVTIVALSAALSLDPLSVTSGQNVTVTMLVQNTGTITTLSSGISSTDTTIPIASTTSFPGSGTLLIDSEEMAYTGTTGTSFTGVTRGVNGTTAAAHSNGAVVRSTAALGTFVPTLSSSGTATATLVSGPTPAMLASLPPGQTGVFQWVYAITGTASQTYQFQGSVTADVSNLSSSIGAGDTTIPVVDTTKFPAAGTLLIDFEKLTYTGTTGTSFTGVTRGANGTTAAAHASGATVYGQQSIVSNTAQSQQGTISSLVVTTSPSTVSSATAPLSLAFTLSNRTGAALRSVCMYQPNATFTAAYASASSACGSWTVAPFGGARPGVRFTANNNPSRVANGGSCVFTVNYSSAPTVTKDTEYVFQFDGLTGANCSAGYRGTAYGRLTVTEYAIALTHAPATAPADGSSQVTLTATLTRAGSPLANRTIAFTTTAGKLSSSTAVTNASGQAQVILTAPASSTAVTASLTATYVKAVGRDSVNFSAFSGPNLQYIGGTLSPMAVPKGSSCPSLTFAIQVRNVGTANTTLNSNSLFTFTDGTNTYTAYLNSSTNVNTGAAASLSFGSPTSAGGGGGVALSPSFANGTYMPSLSFYGTGIASPPQVRPVSDRVTVAGTCSTVGVGTIRILDWREIVR